MRLLNLCLIIWNSHLEDLEAFGYKEYIESRIVYEILTGEARILICHVKVACHVFPMGKLLEATRIPTEAYLGEKLVNETSR